MCIEKWLMFTANVDPTLVNVTDSLFCIRTKGINVLHISIFHLRKKCFCLNELERVGATTMKYYEITGYGAFY